jgi:hypothetical protein
MMPSRGMGDINPEKLKSKGQTMTRKDGDKFTMYKDGGKVKSRVNEAGNYTKPGLRKSIFERIKAGGKGGCPRAVECPKGTNDGPAVQESWRGL